MNDLETWGEIQEMYMNADAQKQEELVSYLTFCAGRLKEGASVEAIWNEWQEARK